MMILCIQNAERRLAHHPNPKAAQMLAQTNATRRIQMMTLLRTEKVNQMTLTICTTHRKSITVSPILSHQILNSFQLVMR